MSVTKHLTIAIDLMAKKEEKNVFRHQLVFEQLKGEYMMTEFTFLGELTL